ncbi:MAG: XkdX family protein [Prevotella sp.]|nr:XkdX family protein [Prevotella sp.]
MFEFLKMQYAMKGAAFIPTLKKMVVKSRITAEQYEEITGKAYNG